MSIFNNANHGDVFLTDKNEKLTYLRSVKYQVQTFHLLFSITEIAYSDEGSCIGNGGNIIKKI